ncbi:MAG: histidine phosphatase family protein [Spirochaetia bacterium]|nr:histidine phosphatase family protein [Spirochaetia bacterium]
MPDSHNCKHSTAALSLEKFCSSYGGSCLKTLILIRHAKSDWEQSDSNDFERQLKKKGIREASQIANKIKYLGIIPDYLLSSPAKRALGTAQAVADSFTIPHENIEERPSLYQGEVIDFITAAAAIPEDKKTVLIFGHNPGISEFASYLAQQDIYMHTSTAVILDIQDLWKQLQSAEQFMILNPGK